MHPEMQVLDRIGEFMSAPFMMMLYGLATHYLKALAEITRIEGKVIAPVTYWKKYPYHTALSLVGAFAGFGALYDTNELTSLTAFGLGYISDSVADILGNRTRSILERNAGQSAQTPVDPPKNEGDV